MRTKFWDLNKGSVLSCFFEVLFGAIENGESKIPRGHSFSYWRCPSASGQGPGSTKICRTRIRGPFLSAKTGHWPSLSFTLGRLVSATVTRYVQNTDRTRTLSIRSRDPSSSEDSFMRLQMHILFPRIWLPSVRMSQKDKRDLSHRMGWKAGRLGILPFHFRFLRSEDSDKTYFLQKPRHYHRLHCRCLIFRCGYYLMHGMRTG